MTGKQLGKIERATFGWGGYQDACIGLSLTFSGDGWGVSTFHGAWGIERSDYCQWTEEDRVRDLGEACLKLRDILKLSKKQTTEQLKGVPVEVEFEGNVIKDYRILTEVL
jgi:hypothetical protein